MEKLLQPGEYFGAQGKFKGELKAKIINFFNICFGKPNIRKVKFVELFLPFSCYLRENNAWSWAFPAFLAFSLRAHKLGQQNALTYDMGNRDFAIKWNKVNTSAVVNIFFVVSLFSFQNEWFSAVSVWTNVFSWWRTDRIGGRKRKRGRIVEFECRVGNTEWWICGGNWVAITTADECFCCQELDALNPKFDEAMI